MVMGFPLNSENNTLISRERKRMRGVVITFRQLSHYVWVRHAKSLWCSIACCKTQSSPKKCIGLCIPLFGIRKEWEERKSKIYIHVHTNIKTICTKYIYVVASLPWTGASSLALQGKIRQVLSRSSSKLFPSISPKEKKVTWAFQSLILRLN